MEKKFDVDSWIARCKSCKFGYSHNLYNIVCKRDGSCEYVKREEPKEPEERICENCNRSLKADRFRQKTRTDGSIYYYPLCMECSRKLYSRNARKRPTLKDQLMSGEKCCRDCHQILPLTEFSKSYKNNKAYFSSYCKMCSRIRSKKYRKV